MPQIILNKLDNLKDVRQATTDNLSTSEHFPFPNQPTSPHLCHAIRKLDFSDLLVVTEKILDHICASFKSHDLIYDQESEPHERFSLFVAGLAGTLLVVAGLLLNLMTLAAKTHRAFFNRNLALFGVLGSDLSLLASGWLCICLPILAGKGRLPLESPYLDLYIFARSWMHVSAACVSWMTTILTFELYIVLAHHLFASATWRKRWAQRVIVGAVCAAVLVNTPRYFEIARKPCCNPHTHELTMEPERSEFGKTVFFAWYNVFVKSIVITFVPFIATIVLACLIRRELSILQYDRRGTVKYRTVSGSPPGEETTKNSSSSRIPPVQRRFSRTVAWIVAKFIVCYSLTTVNDVLGWFAKGERAIFLILSYSSDVSTVLMLVHSASTFLLFIRLKPITSEQYAEIGDLELR